MHELIKSSFYIIFLLTMITMGSIMFFKSKDNKFYRTYGLMALFLGLGESFYLIPRVINLFSSHPEANVGLLQSGKLISSVTIVIVFTLLYKIWRMRYNIIDFKWLDGIIFILAMTSIVLSLTSYNTASSLDVVRIMPFVLMGLVIIVTFYNETKKKQDSVFKFMWLAVALSFVFYIIVELFEKSYGLVVILMLPKTIMYIWIITMGYRSYTKEIKH